MKYRVFFEERRSGYTEVDVPSEEEAKEEAWKIIRDGGGDWSDFETEYVDIEELEGE